jgi:F0F1-type ATP synthase assembly protein I
MTRDEDIDIEAGRARSLALTAAIVGAIALGLFIGWLIWSAFVR